MVLFGEMWTLESGVRRAVECLMGHIYRNMDDSHAEGDLNCRGPVQEVSEETYLCGLETHDILIKNVDAFLPLSKKSAGGQM